MEAKFLTAVVIMAMVFVCSCDDDLVTYKESDIKISVQKGDDYLHDFSFFLGLKKKNPPQIAVWTEDLEGNYLTTIYATHKIATESWSGSSNKRKKEALPAWCYARGVRYADGLYVPTEDEPLTDGISGATPYGSFDLKIHPAGDLRQFVVKIELNHSTDWNDNYPKNANEWDVNYSGGKDGSGQPAVVYSAVINLDSNQKQYTAMIAGHSSPDGSNGEINPDTFSLTSALSIVKNITINVE